VAFMVLTLLDRVRGYPPRVFLQKSSDLLENKGVDFLESDKEFARV
jgi:hypothetical protein